MTLKHALYTMLCLIFWSTTASAAGYYLDIEETDDVRDPIEVLRLTCSSFNEKEAVYLVGHDGIFIPDGFHLQLFYDENGEPESVTVGNVGVYRNIDLTQISTTNLFIALNDTLPRVEDPVEREWYKALRNHIILNSNTMDDCQNTLFQAVAKFITLNDTVMPLNSRMAFMDLVNQLSTIDIDCFNPNAPPFAP